MLTFNTGAFYNMAQVSLLLWPLTCALPCKWPRFDNWPFCNLPYRRCIVFTLQIWIWNKSWDRSICIVISCLNPTRVGSIAGGWHTNVPYHLNPIQEKAGKFKKETQRYQKMAPKKVCIFKVSSMHVDFLWQRLMQTSTVVTSFCLQHIILGLWVSYLCERGSSPMEYLSLSFFMH